MQRGGGRGVPGFGGRRSCRSAGGGRLGIGVGSADSPIPELVDGFGGELGFVVLLGGEEELGKIAEGGGAARGDAIGGKGLHDAGHGAVDVILAGRIGSEVGEVAGEFVVNGRAEAFEGGMGAAKAVAGRNGGESAAASIGIGELAEVVRIVGSFGSHGESIAKNTTMSIY